MTDSPYFYMFLHVAGFSLWSSFWPRKFVKNRLEPKIGFRAYRFGYVAVTIYLFGASLLYLFHKSSETAVLWNFRGEPWLKPVLWAIGGIGVFFMWGVGQLGLSFWGLKNPPPALGLQTGGYYKISRHPLYVAVFCLLLGHTLQLGTGLAVFYFALMELYNVLGVLFFENPALEKEFGENFRAFRKSISPIPFLSLLRGKVKLEPGEIPWAQVILKSGLFAFAVAALHRPFIIPAAYYLPHLGNVSTKFMSEWHRVFGGG